ncbi:MAG TPA: transcriptional regulator NrdR [Candidatus Paenalcaligenes intestinipullorum]|uniref:Transcriptional repressor NrdR n=1 Tax=Candidatus Paenalcaligenes intestinipullorum TaxID=2838718 RepID=A0A9D2U7R0_9BURK|nr:transcriptional regulator NrdR [Candidatus Paenalcaligenes intestinipullorum]
MKCPFCSHSDTQVVDSRVSEEGDVIRRRRRCQACDRRYTTYERPELLMPSVIKRDGSRMDFDINRLRASLDLALRKRAVPSSDVDAAVTRITEHLLVSGDREVTTEYIGNLVMRELMQLDQVAYVRFASVYKSFNDINEFVQAIKEVQDLTKPS